jgi:hypothetical protein
MIQWQTKKPKAIQATFLKTRLLWLLGQVLLALHLLLAFKSSGTQNSTRQLSSSLSAMHPRSLFRGTYTLSLTGFDSSGGLVALRNLGLLDDALEHAISGLDGTGAFSRYGIRVGMSKLLSVGNQFQASHQQAFELREKISAKYFMIHSILAISVPSTGNRNAYPLLSFQTAD